MVQKSLQHFVRVSSSLGDSLKHNYGSPYNIIVPFHKVIVLSQYNYAVIRLEYIMLLNSPIILSSNSFIFYLLFPFLFFFPPSNRSRIKLLTIANYIIYLNYIVFVDCTAMLYCVENLIVC